MATEDDEKLLDGAVKMIGSFAMISKETLPNAAQLNHPENLDFVVNNGYLNWLKSVGMTDGDIAAQLCFVLSSYMVEKHGMILYHDHLPEHKFRMFALKKIREDKQLSVFPLEYAIKVLTGREAFLGFEKIVVEQEGNF